MRNSTSLVIGSATFKLGIAFLDSVEQTGTEVRHFRDWFSGVFWDYATGVRG